MRREEEKIEWSVEGQMLHRIAKRKERPILRAGSTCSHANVWREVMYLVERHDKAYCAGCIDEMVAIGDDPDLEWIEGIA